MRSHATALHTNSSRRRFTARGAFGANRWAQTLWVPTLIGFCLLTPAAFAQKESGVKPEVASALTTYGLTFVLGTYDMIANSGKSSVTPEDASVIGRSGTRLVDDYRQRVRAGVYGANLLHTTMDVAITGGQVMGSAGVATAAPAAAVATLARYGNDKVRDYLVGESVAKAAAALSKGIDSMSAADRAKLDGLLSKNKFAEAAQHFEDTTARLSTMRSSLGTDAQARAILDKAVESAFMRGSSAAIRQAGAAYALAAKVDEDFTNHVKGVRAFTAQAAQKFKQLDDGMNDLKTQLGGVSNRVANLEQAQQATERQLQAIQDVLFDQQPASVKLALLNSGAKPALTGAQRESLKQILDTQVSQEQLLEKANRVVGYARDVNTILTNFGVTDPGLAKAVQYGSVATTALSQVFSGNFLGAIASVSGLFGAGQPDPVQQQFEQVFTQLSKLDKKLDEVIRLQQETLLAVDALSRQLAEVDKRLQYRFDRLDFEIARLNARVEQLIWAGVAGCESAWQSRDVHQNAYNDVEKRFSSYQAMELYTRSFGDQAYRCQTTLVKLYSSMRSQNFAGNPIALDLVKEQFDKTAGIPDEVENGQYGKSALERYRTHLHQPAFDLLRSSWAAHQSRNAGWGNLATAYAMLATPSATAEDLRARIGFLNKTEPKNPLKACSPQRSFVGPRMKVYLCTDGSRYDEAKHAGNDLRAVQTATSFLQVPVVRDQVSELTKYAALVAGPSDIATGSSSPGARSINEVIASGRASLGRLVITGALMVSDVSIAQQAMIYGDFTAWFIFEQLWDPAAKRFRTAAASEADKPRFELARKLLMNASNAWLQRNVLMLILQAAEKPCRQDNAPQPCLNRQMLYELAYDRFFPTEGKGENLKLIPPSTDMLAAARDWMLALFDIHPAAAFEISDLDGNQSGRKVLLKLDGYVLQMPLPSNWARKTLVYPPMMYERINDSVVLAQRLADYTVFDNMDNRTKVGLVRITTKGVH